MNRGSLSPETVEKIETPRTRRSRRARDGYTAADQLAERVGSALVGRRLVRRFEGILNARTLEFPGSTHSSRPHRDGGADAADAAHTSQRRRARHGLSPRERLALVAT